MIATRQLRELGAALADFYRPGLDTDTYVDRTFALTARLLRFDLNSHGTVDNRSGTLSAHFDSTPPGLADAFAAFGRHMRKYQAFRFDPATNEGRPFSARDFYSKPAFENLDIHQEVYRPMRLADHCFVHVPTDALSTVFVGFMRDEPFDRNEKALLELLQPHLANGRAIAFAASAVRDLPIAPELFLRAGYTPRECDVLFWLTRGKSNEDMAHLIGIRADSVSRHLRAIYEKLGVEQRVAATLRALELARRLHAEMRVLSGGKAVLEVATR